MQIWFCEMNAEGFKKLNQLSEKTTIGLGDHNFGMLAGRGNMTFLD
jgi:hypothetical protein